jgi:feruloyl-CoA synthase
MPSAKTTWAACCSRPAPPVCPRPWRCHTAISAPSPLTTWRAFGRCWNARPCYLDWLPWHHGLGGVLNMTRVVTLGVPLIDDGRPLPGHFERTVRNMRDVAATVSTAVPAGWTMLVAGGRARSEVVTQPVLRGGELFLRRRQPAARCSDRIHALSERTIGERVAFCSPRLHRVERRGPVLHVAKRDHWEHRRACARRFREARPAEGGDGRYEIRASWAPTRSRAVPARLDLTAAVR